MKPTLLARLRVLTGLRGRAASICGLLALAVNFFVVSLAGATGTLDQQQPNHNFGAKGGIQAQTFTAGITGTLDQIDLVLTGNPTNVSTAVQIRTTSGNPARPTDVVLASTLVVPSGNCTLVSISFSAPALVQAETVYAIVFNGPNIQFCYMGSSTTDPYPRGEALFRQETGGIISWVTLGSFNTPPIFTDWEFATYVSPQIDKTPPTVSCSVTPSTLWPPNHKLVPVQVTVLVTDPNGSGPNGYKLVAITSNEGNIAKEQQGFVVGTSSTSGQLLAERDGKGMGRVYTLTYQGSDVAGNTATCTTMVTVPHDRGH